MVWASQKIFAGRTTFHFCPNVAILFHHGTKFKAILFYPIMRQSYGPRRIFLLALLNLTFVRYGHILGKTLCTGPKRRPGRQAHGGTALAPRHHVRCPWGFLGLVDTSRTSLVRNNERYLAFSLAISRAFLEMSDLRCQVISFHL